MATLSELKKIKEDSMTELFEKCKVFFAFSTEQFEKNKTELSENDKYVNIGTGGFLPKSLIENYKKGIKQIIKIYEDSIKEFKLEKEEILYELRNHECFYTSELEDVIDLFEGRYTVEEIQNVYFQARQTEEVY